MEVHIGMERRRKPRIDNPFPVTVRGVDASGQAFKVHTVLDNLSAGGLYVRLMRRVERGARGGEIVMKAITKCTRLLAVLVGIAGLFVATSASAQSVSTDKADYLKVARNFTDCLESLV